MRHGSGGEVEGDHGRGPQRREVKSRAVDLCARAGVCGLVKGGLDVEQRARGGSGKDPIDFLIFYF